MAKNKYKDLYEELKDDNEKEDDFGYHDYREDLDDDDYEDEEDEFDFDEYLHLTEGNIDSTTSTLGIMWEENVILPLDLTLEKLLNVDLTKDISESNKKDVLKSIVHGTICGLVDGIPLFLMSYGATTLLKKIFKK